MAEWLEHFPLAPKVRVPGFKTVSTRVWSKTLSFHSAGNRFQVLFGISWLSNSHFRIPLLAKRQALPLPFFIAGYA